VQFGSESDRLSEAEIAQARQRMKDMGMDVSAMTDEDLQAAAQDRARRFREDAPITAAEAATIILDGVKADQWRILVGEDAKLLDQRVRQQPEQAYEPEFFQRFVEEAGWRLG
jgi:post-segregation antitoxin (ccd killing protein)